MQNRRSPTSLDRRAINTPSNQVYGSGLGRSPVAGSGAVRTAATAGGGVSPGKRTTGTPVNTYKNQSDGVSAVLGSGLTNSPSRPRTREGPRVTLPSTPTNTANKSNGASPSAPSSKKKVEYSCKVLMSSGSAATKPISLHCGADGVQGFRPTMEDCHFDVLNNGPHGGDQISILGVLDGHCGKHVADLGAQILPESFLSHPEIGKNNSAALVDSIVETDRRIFQHIGRSDGGSTLICAAIHNRILTVACLGDARAVLCDGGVAVPMSVDHKPGDMEECARVRRCGGMVQFGRVMGVLAVSRALGDFEFKFNGPTYPTKEFMVSNIADIKQINITDSTRFLILACDGLWDVLTNEDAVEFVKMFLARNEKDLIHDPSATLSQCALKLANAAIDAGSMDNVSIQILLFHQPETSGESYSAAASRGGGNGLHRTPSGSSGMFTNSSLGRSSLSGSARGGIPASPQGGLRGSQSSLPSVGGRGFSPNAGRGNPRSRF